MNIPIQKDIGDKIARLDDDVVALIALDMNQLGLLDASGFTKWRSYMTAGNLYENHWLIAYEAIEQGWLPSKNGNDYIEADDFFSILRSNNVRFFGAAIVDTASFFEYDADEDDLSDDGDDEELLIEEDDEPSDNSDLDELLTE